MNDRIVAILDDARAQIVANIQAEGITASGRTEKSFMIEEYSGGVRLVSRGKNIAPVHTLEVGRAGGNVPKNFTQIIKQWIINKGISYPSLPYKRQPSERWQPKYTPEERGLLKLAAAIAWGKIKPFGTDRHINPRNDIYSPVVNDAVAKLRKLFLLEVKKIIKTN